MSAPAFVTLVADPPWKFGDALPGKKRGAKKHYKCLTVEELSGLQPYRELARADKHAVLFLWRVAAMQEEAFELARAWNFVVKTELVWNKTTVTGKAHFGMGHYLRASHETCLVCVRGRVTFRNRSTRDRFEAPVGRHSEKPEAFYDLVRVLTYEPRTELFARRHRPGFQCLGDELPLMAARRAKAGGAR